MNKTEKYLESLKRKTKRTGSVLALMNKRSIYNK